MNALYNYGNKFEDCLNDFDIQLIQTSYDFEKVNQNGFQNTYWNIGTYQDYKFVKVANIKTEKQKE